eukprot:CAMPEP_0117506304 /NCGR_PEP_ID=MMETSP0784-20121206/25839_1 /TAXON_ID=39447 /ORGANISM="" /LENGTH=74 /DNA_ID=CAMNT_0005301773 /DNA_START=198 /DNA_END=421 /DNA_ORIENTATION=-
MTSESKQAAMISLPRPEPETHQRLDYMHQEESNAQRIVIHIQVLLARKLTTTAPPASNACDARRRKSLQVLSLA